MLEWFTLGLFFFPVWFVFKPKSPRGSSWEKDSGRKGVARAFPSAASQFVFCWSFFPSCRLDLCSVPGRNAFQAWRWLRTTGHTGRAGLSRAGGSWSSCPHSHFALPSVAGQRGDSSLDLLCASRLLWPCGYWGPRSPYWGWMLSLLPRLLFPRSASERFCQDRNSSFDLLPWRGMSSSEPFCKFSPYPWIV